MPRKKTGRPRGRPKGQTRLEHDFSQLVLALFEEQRGRALTFEDASEAVAKHPDVLDFQQTRNLPVLSVTADAIAKRYKVAREAYWSRVRAGLRGEPPIAHRDWEGVLPGDSDPVDLQPFPRIQGRRGD